jgi:hypothetical protein
VPVVHGEHRRVAENQRPSRYQVRCRRHRNLHYRRLKGDHQAALADELLSVNRSQAA